MEQNCLTFEPYSGHLKSDTCHASCLAKYETQSPPTGTVMIGLIVHILIYPHDLVHAVVGQTSDDRLQIFVGRHRFPVIHSDIQA
jgi:hypothetical protein